MKKAIQAKNLSRFLFLLRNCKYTHFTLDKSGFTITLSCVVMTLKAV